MEKIKIFLASSCALKAEREQFETEINRKNKAWFDHGFFLHPDIWEDMTTRLGRSQDEYNKFVKDSDLFVLLVQDKLGMYSAEEFENAFDSFQETRKPFIFVYFKQTTAGDASLQAFKDKLRAMEHFPAEYTDFDNLWLQFNKELDRLLLAGFKINQRLLPQEPGVVRNINQGGNAVYAEGNVTITNNNQQTSYGDHAVQGHQVTITHNHYRSDKQDD